LSYYEAIIKVNLSDDPEKRALGIAEGIGYACALLMDEYGWKADAIAEVLERTADDVYDEEAQRDETGVK
jgi:hypothetical protein